MVTKIFYIIPAILNVNGLKYEKYVIFLKFPKGKKYIKKGQKKMSKIKKNFTNRNFQKNTLLKNNNFVM